MLTFRRPRFVRPSLVVPFLALAAVTCTATGVTDTPVDVSTIDVNPTTIALTIGQRQTVTATPKSASGKSLTARAVTWSSGATNIASVDAAGSVLGVGAGTTTITATSGAVTKQIPVTVTSITFALTITGSGNGTGTVTSNPAGITCRITNGAAGTGCSGLFNSGASVTLTAAPDSGNTAGGFSGGCTASGASCTIAMTSARAANAQFNRPLLQATTDSADQVAISSARLFGTIIPDGGHYTTWFEVSTDPAIGSNPNITGGANDLQRTDCPISSRCSWNDRIQGLRSGTTYFFRIVANKNATGESRGLIRSFATPSSASSPVLSALTTTQDGAVNTCTFTTGVNGTAFSHRFAFTDPNGDVVFTGSPVTITFIGQPSGTTGSLSTTVVSSTGTGSSGTITTGLCWRFGTDTAINFTVQLRDNAGNTSGTLLGTIPRPAGANSTQPAPSSVRTLSP
jgi:hypothetical protein